MKSTASPAVSIIVLTYNEDVNISDCLRSVSDFDDVHVLDSGSTDGTVELALAAGARVHTNPFGGFGSQRNFAIDRIPVKYHWQFHLDADERLTPELRAEIASIAESPAPEGGFRVASQLIFFDRWLKRSGQYPAYQVRFFHRDRLRFENHGHGQREATVHAIGRLRNPLRHLAFSKGIDDWFRKHVGYARCEALKALCNTQGTESIWSRDATNRRRAMKRLAGRLPGRYFLRLVHLLLIRRGILDGWAGVTYAHMVATYESMIDVYLRLLRRGLEPNPPIKIAFPSPE